MLALFFAGSGPALAHAFPSSSEPSENATVTAPTQVLVTFSQALEKPFSGLELRDPAGKPVAGAAALDDSGPAQLGVRLPGKLAPGSYTILWHATSVDTHRTEGSLHFTVAP